MLTTTTPLVSGWFEAVRSRDDGGDPYWLYALSNGGSLLALLAYPLIIEPALGLQQQRSIWMVGYGLLIALLAVAATRVVPVLRGRAATNRVESAAARGHPGRARRGRSPGPGAVAGCCSRPSRPACCRRSRPSSRPTSCRRRCCGSCRWRSTSARSSSPSRRGPRRRSAWRSMAAPAMVTLLWVPYGSAGGWPILLLLAMELVAFGVVATALHGLLAQDRPSPARLTEFYLVMSLGGALASAFVALVAPNVFPAVWEYPILLVGALVALALVVPAPVDQAEDRPRPRLQPVLRRLARSHAPVPRAGRCRWPRSWSMTGALAAEAGIRWLLVGGLVLLVGARPWFLAGATAFVLAPGDVRPPAAGRLPGAQLLRRHRGHDLARRRADPADERHDGPRIAVDGPGPARAPRRPTTSRADRSATSSASSASSDRATARWP